MDKPPICHIPSRHTRYLQFLHNKGRVSPLDVPPFKNQSKPVEYKTIRQEAEEFKAKMRAARAEKNASLRAQQNQSKKRHAKPLHPCRAPLHPCRAPLHPCRAPLHPRESTLHKEPSRFTGVLKEGWNYRVELMKYHFGRLKRNLLPTLFCLRAEIEDQQ